MVRFLARKVKKYSIGVDFTRTQLLIKNISSVIGLGGDYILILPRLWGLQVVLWLVSIGTILLLCFSKCIGVEILLLKASLQTNVS